MLGKTGFLSRAQMNQIEAQHPTEQYSRPVNDIKTM